MSLYSLAPDADALLALEPEELAGIVLQYLNGLPQREKEHLNRYNFGLDHTVLEYPSSHRERLSRALMEAWAWLEREGLLAAKPLGAHRRCSRCGTRPSGDTCVARRRLRGKGTGVSSILKPPVFLAPDVFLRGARESDEGAASTRSEFPENFLSVDEPTGSDVSIRVTKRLVESGAVGIIQPVARIKRKEFDFRAIWEIRGFVNDESPCFDRGLDGHGGSVPFGGPSPKCLHEPERFGKNDEDANALDPTRQVTGSQQLATTNRTPSVS